VHHVLADAALADIDAEFEQFTVNAGCTPSGILAAHLANQISDLTGDGRSSRLANMPDLPRPEEAKPGTMPGQDRFGLDDSQCRAPVTPDSRQPDPQQPVPGCQFRALPHRPLKHPDLVAQGEVLELKGCARTEDRGQSGKEYRQRNEHRRREL